jgi:hypothetical protein
MIGKWMAEVARVLISKIDLSFLKYLVCFRPRFSCHSDDRINLC